MVTLFILTKKDDRRHVVLARYFKKINQKQNEF